MNYRYNKKIENLRKKIAKLQEENAALQISNDSLKQNVRQISKEKYLLEQYIEKRESELEESIVDVNKIREKYLDAMEIMKSEKQLYKLRFQQLKKDIKHNK